MFLTRHHPEIDSTNLEAVRLIQKDKIHAPTLIYADCQTSGQGSRGRKWSSDKSGNLLATYIFPLDSDWPPLTYLAHYAIAHAAYHALHSALPAHTSVQLKWPNDLLVDGHKICGMLHEIHTYHGHTYFISGIGVNIDWHPPQTDGAFPPTSLNDHLACPITRDTFLQSLSEAITHELQLWKTKPFKDYIQPYLPKYYHWQEQISISPLRDRTAQITGIFENIAEDGSLCLNIKGKVQKISTGDIFPTLIMNENSASA